MSLSESVRTGDRLALSRLLTLVENGRAEGRAALNELFSSTGSAHLIGVTGAPGTGKSSLVNQLARYYRSSPDEQSPPKIAIIAVDPTSPFTGGAILGDRIRMRDLVSDPGVFIRSMASRGALGGLAGATLDFAMAFDAGGFEMVFVETVGAGQVEVDVARLAHTTLVVEAPGLGDDVQAIKAGMMEVADILVVNKSDRAGADQTARGLRSALRLASPVPHVFRHHGLLGERAPDLEEEEVEEEPWMPPVVMTVATDGEGISDLADAIADHEAYLRSSGEWARRERARLQAELEGMLQDRLVRRWRSQIEHALYRQTLDRLVARQISPSQAVETLLDGQNGVKSPA